MKAIPGASVSSCVVISSPPKSATKPSLPLSPKSTGKPPLAPTPKTDGKPPQAPIPPAKPLHLFCDHGKKYSVSFPPTAVVREVLLKLVKKYWDSEVTEKTLSEYCLVNIQDIHKPLPLKKTLSQCGIENEMTLTGKESEKY